VFGLVDCVFLYGTSDYRFIFPLIRLVLLIYLGTHGCAENVERNAEFCKVLLSHRRDADCGVPLRKAHGLRAGKKGEGCKDAVGGNFVIEISDGGASVVYTASHSTSQQCLLALM
jgi:hypothetical protein